MQLEVTVTQLCSGDKEKLKETALKMHEETIKQMFIHFQSHEHWVPTS